MENDYVYQLQTRYTFEDFCNDLKTEIGETLYKICNPRNPHKDYIVITIPQSNNKRITETLNYGSCNVKHTNFTVTRFYNHLKQLR